MMPATICLVDRSAPLTDAWEQAFEPCESVEVHRADYFSFDADALVSPANSFGVMDGGLDLALRQVLGAEIEGRVQAAIVERHHGELPVGAAEVVATGHARWPFLVVAPTMRVPEDVAHTLNAYLAFRAALLATAAFNRAAGGRRITSLVAPGLGTGVGRMAPRSCAAQMRVAFDAASRPARIPSFEMIHRVHRTLRSPP
jgi:O-acetyl-ADP-ribose deacetylase (regulator of RNase III)